MWFNMRLFNTVKNYAKGISILKDWLGDGGEVVDEHTAQTRTNTCLTCPNNVIGVPITEEAAQFVKEQLELKNHLKLNTVGDRKLHTCKVCSCVLNLKIWCPIDRVKPEPGERDNYPDYCWLLKESA